MIRGGLATINVTTHALVNVVTFKYNPDTVTRTVQPRAIAAETGDRLEALRLTGPPHETIKLEAELDAADELEVPDDHAAVAQHGLLPALAALEQIVTPTVASLLSVDQMFARGAMEIIPQEAPLAVLIWGSSRVIPVLVSSVSITEQAFDANLRPIRVKVDLELKILTSSDLPNDHLGTSLYLAYRRGMERLGALVGSTDVRPLGLTKLP